MRVPRHLLGTMTEQIGRPTVIGDGERGRYGAQDRLLEEVVGELVLGAGGGQQPGPDQALAGEDDLHLGLPDQAGEEHRVDSGAEDGRGEGDTGRLGLEPVELTRDRAGDVVRYAHRSGRHRPKARHDAERVALTAGAHLFGTPLEPGCRRQGMNGRGGQRAKLHRVAEQGQLRHRGQSLRPRGGDQQHRGRAQLFGEMGQQVDGDAGAVLQVVDREQHRHAGRQSGKRGYHGVERPAPGQFMGHDRRRGDIERLAQLG